MAFTPINSSDPQNVDPDVQSTNAQEATKASSSHKVAVTVVSAYLGRGELAKKSAASSKKRNPAAISSSNAKRRQTSTVNNGLNVSKRDVHDELDVTQPGNPKLATLKSSLCKPYKTDTTASEALLIAPSVSSNGDELASTAAKPISVYSSKTTMDALVAISMPTSVEAAKASDGQGVTLYQGSSSTASYSSSIATLVPTVGNDQRPKFGRAARDSDGSSTKNRPEGIADVQDGVTQLAWSHNLFGQPLCFEGAEDCFSDFEMTNLADSNESEADIRPNTPPSRGRKLNIRDVDELEDYGGALLSDADKRALKINTSAESALKPIVRKPFPPSILDRSPIFGASRSVVLRTCFRVGEALMSGCHGVRSGHDIVIELYARVTASWREPAPGRKQHLTFKDLYHDNPPYLEGTFELWQQAQLWDLDSKVFLGAWKGTGVMCRAIARMKRDGQKWRLDVLSVWGATWEDVNFAAGICTGALGR